MPDMASINESQSIAFFIGHPGHELRVFGWARLVHPEVFVLTDGSGAGAATRLERTTQLLSQIGAKRGNVYGRFSDEGLYQALIAGEASKLTAIVDELAKSWIRSGIEVVASDSYEGFSPTHDLCCEMAQAATDLVHGETGRRIQRFTFPLTEWEGAIRDVGDKSLSGLRLELNDETLDAKITAARTYFELDAEVDHALALRGPEYFREEYMHPIYGWTNKEASYKPLYEEYGEQRVADGKYKRVLRYRNHMLPIFQALREHVERRPLRGASSIGIV